MCSKRRLQIIFFNFSLSISFIIFYVKYQAFSLYSDEMPVHLAISQTNLKSFLCARSLIYIPSRHYEYLLKSSFY